jgi:hypothetical protein
VKPFLYHAFTIRTKFTPMQVNERISEDVEPLDVFRFLTSGAFTFDRQVSIHRIFEGEINPQGFSLRRVTVRDDSFKAVFIGTIVQEALGSTVHVHARPGLYALTLLPVMIGVAAFLAYQSWISAQANDKLFSVGLVAAITIVLVFICITFWEDVESTQSYLEATLLG